jgi:hypothetical protein
MNHAFAVFGKHPTSGHPAPLVSGKAADLACHGGDHDNFTVVYIPRFCV